MSKTKPQLLEEAKAKVQNDPEIQDDIKGELLKKISAADKGSLIRFLKARNITDFFQPEPEDEDGLGPDTDVPDDDQEPEHDPESFVKLLETNANAQEFMSMCMATGTVSDPRKMDDYEKAEWLGKYYSWLSAGKPRPQMPKTDPEKIVIPVAFYRLLDCNQDKMFWLDNLGNRHGIDEKTVYASQKHPITGDTVQSNIPTGEKTRTYTAKFSATEFSKLLKKAIHLNPPNVKIRFYAMKGSRPHVVRQDDFAMPSFEELIQKITDHRYV